MIESHALGRVELTGVLPDQVKSASIELEDEALQR